MINQKEIRLSGINSDDNYQVLESGDYLNLMNASIGLSQDGKDKQIENVKGTLAIPNSVYPVSGTNQTIGSCVDIEGKRLVWCVYNSAGYHGIYVYDTILDAIFLVISDSQITGGLGFDKNYRIDRNCKVVNGIFYWVSGNSEPRKINLDKGIKTNNGGYVTKATAYATPLKYTTTTIIRRPPNYAIVASKVYDATFPNIYTGNQAFQMYYYYDYVDNEQSRLSASSNLINYNSKTDNYNEIQCLIPFSEYIDDDIQRINICAKNLDTNVTSIVKTFDKANSGDLSLINAHNSGSTQLQYKFYNNISGLPLSSQIWSVPFDSVPINSKTLETAINRLMLGNNLEGYDTPVTTSISLSQDTSTTETLIFKTGSSYNVSIEFLDRFRRKCGVVKVPLTINIADKTYSTALFVYRLSWALSNTNALSEIPDWAYYYQLVITKNQTKQSFVECITQDASYATKDDNGVYDLTTTVYDASKTAAIAVDVSNLLANGLGYTYNEGDYAIIHKNDNSNYTLPLIGQNGNSILLAAKDIGTITNSFKWQAQPILINHVTYTLPLNLNQLYSQPGFTVQSAQFGDLGAPALDNPNWVIQITDGLAHTFNLNGLINLKPTATYPSDYMQISYVLAGFGMSDIIVDLYTQSGAAAGTNYAMNFSTSVTIPSGYTKMMIIYRSSRGEIMPNLMTGYVTISRPTDFNLIEIYTPHKPNDSQEPYYECTPVFAVNNAGTNSRQYSTIGGTILGDTYILQRKIFGSTTLYNNEAMSPNDLYWKKWNTNTGWVNFITQLGQARNEHEIRWSDVYTTGTNNNGLSTFESLNFKTTPLGIGTIQKLQLASKTEEQGVIMLAIGSFQTVSCYLGETQLVGSSKNSALVQTTDVIGTMNVLKGMFGTNHPETVIEYLGLVFWYDINNGAIVQYSINGLEAISRFKMVSFFQKYAKNYNVANSTNLDNINGFHHIPTSINPFTKRFNVTTPALIYSNYATILPSYSGVPSYASSIINRFNPYDGLAKTVCYDIVENRWKEIFEFAGEHYDYFENIMFGWKNGVIYKHDADSSNYNTFYGTQYPIRYCLTPNMPLSSVKDVMGLAIEGSVIPDYTVVMSEYPNIQITDLINTDYIDKEGIKYVSIFRDRLSPNVSGTAEYKMYHGDVVKSKTPLVMCEFHQYNSLIYVNFVDVRFAESYGQKGILQSSSAQKFNNNLL